MTYRDTAEGWGLVTRLMHWVMALAIFALFALGWWMVELDYYSPYYNSAPHWHKSLGMIFLAILAVRIGWRLVNPKPRDDFLSPFEQRAARLVHLSFYPLMIVMFVSGYLIPTADGRPISVFGLVNVPALIIQPGMESVAGWVHRWSSYAVMILAGLHAAAALKHHFADRSPVLTRMWSGPPS